jgi:FixJ family two-component response regulator
MSERLSVLLVDDEKSFIDFLAIHLREEYGFLATSVHSGQEALALLERPNHGFSVVVLDYMMPEMNGLNVLQRMLEQKNETPVVMLTGAGSESLAVEAMKLGVYDYLRKEEITLERLATVIQATHERRLFRISKQLEEERSQEIRLNNEATEKVRDVMNAIAPPLNESFAAIGVELDQRVGSLMCRLSGADRLEFERLIEEIRKHVAVLETGVRGLLGLYQILHAHHSESGEIEHMRKELELKLSPAFRQ